MGILLRNALAKVSLWKDISTQNSPMVFRLLEDLMAKIDIYLILQTLFRYFFADFYFFPEKTTHIVRFIANRFILTLRSFDPIHST